MTDVSLVQLLFGLCVGISLSAACGFRVFVPLLVVALAVHFGGFHVNENFAWIGSWMSILMLSTATVVEVLGYYIPWVDNLLDTLSTPLAIVAGTVVMCGMLPDLHPCLKWGIAGVLGGGSAGVVQASTAILRGGSTATTGGLGNCLVSTGENVCSVIVSVLAILLPLLACIVILIALAFSIKIVFRLLVKNNNRNQTVSAA